MATISDLPRDLVREIFSRVPLTSLDTVRSTCKKWNTLSKNQILGKAKAGSARMGFTLSIYSLLSIKFDFKRIRNGSFDVDPSRKTVSKFDQFHVCRIFQCDGLLLCLALDEDQDVDDSSSWRLVVWNPYLGQTRWIQPTNNFHGLFRDVSENMYALGYDKNKNNYKILRFLNRYSEPNMFEIYCFNSSSWRVLDVMNPGWTMKDHESSVSVKGNTYLVATDRAPKTEDFLLCFDFTQERFGPRLSLPFSRKGLIILSCTREDQLAVLYQRYQSEILEIWVSTKIEPNAVSWCKFLEVDMKKHDIFFVNEKHDIGEAFQVYTFFIDEKKLVVVCYHHNGYRGTNYTAYIFGEDEYFKSAPRLGYLYTNSRPRGLEFYVPSLVQLQTNPTLKGKEEDY